MARRKLLLGAGLAAALAVPTLASAEGKFSAHVFGDYYYFIDDHDSVAVDQNGFWIRRVNLTWDEKFDDTYSARLRLEAASPGSFDPDEQAVMISFVKDAWIRWKKDNQSVYLGLTNTVSHSLTEDWWGYRHLEKIPGELQGIFGSRDMGLGAAGTLGGAERFGYHVMVGNGTGTRNELDSRKKVSGAARFFPAESFAIELYGDYEDRSNATDRTSFRVFAGWKSEKARAGAEYTQQTRDRSDGTSYDLSIISGFATGKVAEKVWLVGRVDRNLEAGASDPGAPYIPMDSSVSSTFLLAGVELVARDNITFTPNLEAVLYDEPDGGGAAPQDDIVGRVTFNFKY